MTQQENNEAYSMGPLIRPKDILKEFTADAGLIRWVFWEEILDKIIYKTAIDTDIHTLKTIYQYEDIDDMFRRKIDWKIFKAIINVVFRYVVPKENTQTVTKT